LLTFHQASPLQRSWHGGGPPEWQPRFSGKEIRQARAVARRLTAPHAQVQRAQLALLLYRYPSMTSPEAARRLGRSASWVYLWRRRWVAEGFRLEDLPRPGRPRAFPPDRACPGDRGGL
jgi:Homeodomain-like domain